MTICVTTPVTSVPRWSTSSSSSSVHMSRLCAISLSRQVSCSRYTISGTKSGTSEIFRRLNSYRTDFPGSASIFSPSVAICCSRVRAILNSTVTGDSLQVTGRDELTWYAASIEYRSTSRFAVSGDKNCFMGARILIALLLFKPTACRAVHSGHKYYHTTENWRYTEEMFGLTSTVVQVCLE